MSRSIKVLCIDGGGIRGIIPALILAETENLAGKPVAGLFDLIAGTSTGALLALALAKPDSQGRPQYSAEQIVSLYEKEGRRIFRRSLWHKMLALGNIAEEKYPSRYIEGVLEQYFGEARLKDALTEVIVPSYETERRFPFFFRSRRARTMEAYDFPMRHVVRAAAAAPTYFEPAKLDAEPPAGYYSLIDGGVFANNPAMCGFVEAKTTYPDADDFLLVSLGTGELTFPLPYRELKGWGLARWARPVLNVAFDGLSGTVDYQLRQLLPPTSGGALRYYRFQARLEPGHEAMDNASEENLRALKLVAEKLLRERRDELRTLCAELTRA